MLVTRQPDVKTVLKKNPNWWGIKDGRFEGNADEVVYTPIVSDATRVAALISGEVDLVNDPPPQDVPRLAQTRASRCSKAPRTGSSSSGWTRRATSCSIRTSRQEPVQGQAGPAGALPRVDIEAIHKSTMRGLSQPSGAMLPSPVTSTPEVEKRLAYDRDLAKKLLAEAATRMASR